MSPSPAGEVIAVLGTGTIGASWAAFYALQGFEVCLHDQDPAALEAGERAARGHLERLRELGLAEAAAVGAAAARLRPMRTLEAMAKGVSFVQESVRETYDVKKDVFKRLDAIAPPDTLIASSSSGLLISEIQSVMQRPARALLAHPFNPPHLIPLVELVAGRQTGADAMERARLFFERLGKTPVVLHKEIPGHIANRLAAALWREAIDLVASGVASVEDVDKALRAGPGLRWAIMGQHMIYHLGGGQGGYRYFIDHIGKTFEEYWRTMATWTAIPEQAKAAVIAGVQEAAAGRSLAELGRERDEALAKILKVLRQIEAERPAIQSKHSGGTART